MIRSEKIAYGGLIFLCVAFTIIFSVSFYFQDWQKRNIVPNVQQQATSQRSLNDTAYVFLGLGATAHQLNCPAAIESLVRFGGWGGKVYLITDQENCFDRKKMILDSGIDPDNLKMIVLKEDFGGGGIDLWNSRVGFSKNRLRSKSMKTKLFDYIDDPQINVLAYVDCDIIFGVEGCPAQFVEGGVPWSKNSIRFSRVTTDPTNGRLIGIHTGTIVMHREHSKEVLQRWYDRLSSGVDNMDRTAYLMEYDALQDSYEQAYHNTTLSNARLLPPSKLTSASSSPLLRRRAQSDAFTTTHMHPTNHSHLHTHTHTKHLPHNVMMPSELTYKSTAGEELHYEIFVDPEMEKIPCMTHVSKARCDQFGRQAVQRVVDRFQLRTYNQGYLYCPNPALAPILYGWFPLSYLPFCPKIEMFY